MKRERKMYIDSFNLNADIPIGYCVYIIHLPLGMYYVGMTGDLRLRLRAHMYTKEGPVYKFLILNYYLSFDVDIIPCNDKGKALELEKQLINNLGLRVPFNKKIGFNWRKDEKIKNNKDLQKETVAHLDATYGKDRQIIGYRKGFENVKILFSCPMEASLATGADRSNISKVCMGKRNKVKGWIFSYTSNQEEVNNELH